MFYHQYYQEVSKSYSGNWADEKVKKEFNVLKELLLKEIKKKKQKEDSEINLVINDDLKKFENFLQKMEKNHGLYIINSLILRIVFNNTLDKNGKRIIDETIEQRMYREKLYEIGYDLVENFFIKYCDFMKRNKLTSPYEDMVDMLKFLYTKNIDEKKLENIKSSIGAKMVFKSLIDALHYQYFYIKVKNNEIESLNYPNDVGYSNKRINCIKENMIVFMNSYFIKEEDKINKNKNQIKGINEKNVYLFDDLIKSLGSYKRFFLEKVFRDNEYSSDEDVIEIVINTIENILNKYVIEELNTVTFKGIAKIKYNESNNCWSILIDGNKIEYYTNRYLEEDCIKKLFIILKKSEKDEAGLYNNENVSVSIINKYSRDECIKISFNENVDKNKQKELIEKIVKNINSSIKELNPPFFFKKRMEELNINHLDNVFSLSLRECGLYLKIGVIDETSKINKRRKI